MARRRRSDRLVIGLTGSFGSGCSTVAQLLAASGDFHCEPLSKAIKQEADKRGAEPERRVLQALGDSLRRRYGTDYLAKRAVRAAMAAASTKSWVLDGIRNVGEADWLRSEFPHFYLLAVDATRDTRYLRLKDLYDKNEAAFDEDDERDRLEPHKWGQQVSVCVDRADALLINESDFAKQQAKKELRKKIDICVGLMREPGSRQPSARELLMHLAYSASLRSSCMKRQVGCVVVAPFAVPEASEPGVTHGDSEFTVVAVGYNEVPLGQEACREEYEGRCYRDVKRDKRVQELKQLGVRCRCKSPVDGSAQCPKCKQDLRPLYRFGKALDYCRALHAEETAILHGTRTGGPALLGTVLYTTTFPCLLCAKMIVYAGIKEVVYVEAYPMREAMDSLKAARVGISRFEGVKAQAFYKLFKAALTAE